MDIKAVFETINSLNEEYVSVWEDVCNIESPSKSKSGVDAAENYFAALAEARGWKVEFFRQPVSGDVACITLNPESTEHPLCLSAHLDTVHPIGSFGIPAVHIDGEKIYGPGVTDCKGGAVAAALAMDALARNGFDRRPIHLLLQSDEEVGSRLSNKETIKYICDSILYCFIFRTKAFSHFIALVSIYKTIEVKTSSALYYELYDKVSLLYCLLYISKIFIHTFISI